MIHYGGWGLALLKSYQTPDHYVPISTGKDLVRRSILGLSSCTLSVWTNCVSFVAKLSVAQQDLAAI